MDCSRKIDIILGLKEFFIKKKVNPYKLQAIIHHIYLEKYLFLDCVFCKAPKEQSRAMHQLSNHFPHSMEQVFISLQNLV